MACRSAALLLIFGLMTACASAQSFTETALQDAACFGSDENIDSASQIGTACSDLVASASSSATGVTIDCPADCATVFEGVSTACRNSVAASESLGEAYRLIFDACGIDYTASASTPDAAAPLTSLDEPSSADTPSSADSPSSGDEPVTDAPTPTALSGSDLPPQVSGSLADFDCLSTSANAAAVRDFASACADLAPSSDGTSLNCPAACGDAINEISQDCIDTIASSESLGTTYQFIFDSCDVTYSTSGGTPTAATPTPSGSDTPTAGSTPDISTTPTADSTPAPTQAASGTAAPAGLVVALAAALLTLLT